MPSIAALRPVLTVTGALALGFVIGMLVGGSPTVYECKGCQYGCVYNARNFASSYHAIRRAGF